MGDFLSLQRFIEAQQPVYNTALKEIIAGQKRSHWMWYIFPQLKGLGFSQTSLFYGIKNLKEAQDYLAHPVLGKRLTDICDALLKLPGNNATLIFGSPDDMKLRSSMTLFSLVPNAGNVFGMVLQKFFNGKQDDNTIDMLNAR